MAMMEGDLESFGGDEAGEETALPGIPQVDEEGLTLGALALQPANTSATAITREQRRSRRKREIRARTISVKRMTKRELEIGRMLYPETDYYKPKMRAECLEGPRPCPYVSCQHHLYLDVSARTGAIKLNFPDLEVWDMTESCALDIADRGGTTLEDVGAIMNLTRERIRQVEVKALAKLEALKDMSALRDYVDEGPVGKRRLPVLAASEEEEEDEDEAEVDADEAEVDADEADDADDADDSSDAGPIAAEESATDFDGAE
jgi:Sigma-70, region 4